MINDWISILRNQLHELKVLESKSNLYSKAPRPPMQFGLQRDPNSPLPAPPQPLVVVSSLQSSGQSHTTGIRRSVTHCRGLQVSHALLGYAGQSHTAGIRRLVTHYRDPQISRTHTVVAARADPELIPS